MKNLIDILKTKDSCYFYRISPETKIEQLLQYFESNFWQFFYIKGEGIIDKATFLDIWSKTLNFPDYFGNNWDAFDDCLLDLEWCELTPRIIIYNQPEKFAHQDPKEWETVIDVLLAALGYWTKTVTPLYIIFQTEDPLFEAIAKLN